MKNEMARKTVHARNKELKTYKSIYSIKNDFPTMKAVEKVKIVFISVSGQSNHVCKCCRMICHGI